MKRKCSVVGAVVAGALLVPAYAGASITGLPKINPHPVASLPAVPAAPPATRSPLAPFAPTTGASWPGAFDLTVSPPDTNGAIGPTKYIEIINLQIAIYTRAGVGLQTPLSTLTGHSQFNLSDPMVLWDPDTQRFYYNVWDTSNQTMAFGFSKTNSPTAVPGGFCNYTAGFGYTPSEFPDYPKLGQSRNFLMIGVNHYPSSTAPRADRSDLLWISKPQGSAPITACPAATTFKLGKFTNLRNQDGSQAFTPVPAIQDDPLGNGYVVSSSDVECPPTPCPTGTKLTVTTISPGVDNPRTARISSVASVTVPSFKRPAVNAPQNGTANTLDTLDGRLEHAVYAVDPSINKGVIWTGHAVNSAANRSEFRWYELVPTPAATPTVVSKGVVNSSSLFVFNGAVAPDRTVNPSGVAHGDSIVVGFSTSSSTTFPADQMVSKIGAGAQSGLILVHQSTSADNDFTCTAPFGPPCRWGDYGGATSDPAQSLAATHGEVWLTNEAVTGGNNTTWNWEARP